MKSSIKFNSVADRIAYKKREHERLRRERDIVDEADRSNAAFVFYCIPALAILLLIASVCAAGAVKQHITPVIGIASGLSLEHNK